MWTDKILATLRSWFGSDEATESELHQQMEDVGGMDGLRAQIRAEVAAEMQGQIDTAAAEATRLQTALNTAQGELSTAQARIQELEARVPETVTPVKSGGTGTAGDSDMPAWEAMKAYINSL